MGLREVERSGAHRFIFWCCVNEENSARSALFQVPGRLAKIVEQPLTHQDPAVVKYLPRISRCDGCRDSSVRSMIPKEVRLSYLSQRSGSIDPTISDLELYDLVDFADLRAPRDHGVGPAARRVILRAIENVVAGRCPRRGVPSLVSDRSTWTSGDFELLVPVVHVDVTDLIRPSVDGLGRVDHEGDSGNAARHVRVFVSADEELRRRLSTGRSELRYSPTDLAWGRRDFRSMKQVVLGFALGALVWGSGGAAARAGEPA